MVTGGPLKQRILHHVSLPVTDLTRAAAFYDETLGALGLHQVVSGAKHVGYGLEAGKDQLLLVEAACDVLSESVVSDAKRHQSALQAMASQLEESNFGKSFVVGAAAVVEYVVA